MTIEEAKEIIDGASTDYKAKSPIPKGLSILMQFSNDIPCRCEHDQMWAGDFEATVAKMGKLAIETMAKLGWFEDETGKTLAFVTLEGVIVPSPV